jgi:hypothetical protein
MKIDYSKIHEVAAKIAEDTPYSTEKILRLAYLKWHDNNPYWDEDDESFLKKDVQDVRGD